MYVCMLGSAYLCATVVSACTIAVWSGTVSLRLRAKFDYVAMKVKPIEIQLRSLIMVAQGGKK
jgi:hypothetical protein